MQFHHRADGDRHLTAQIIERSSLSAVAGRHIEVDAEFVDDERPRRVRQATFGVSTDDGRFVRFEVEAQGPAVAMQGLGYGGYDDGLGLGSLARRVAPGVRCLGCGTPSRRQAQ